MLKPVISQGVWGYLWGYQDERGLLVIPPLFTVAREFSEGLAAVKFIYSWGYINEYGKVTIAPMFDDASNFCEELAKVRMGSKYSFIDRTGKFITDDRFSWASNFMEGFAKVKTRSYRVGDFYRDYDAFIDRSGQIHTREIDIEIENIDNSWDKNYDSYLAD
jgi:WG containing repeat